MSLKPARRITFTAKGVVEILSFDGGKPKPGQVLVETEASAISAGTELSRLYDFHMAPRPFPQNTGYLTCARAIELGEGVEGISLGELYIISGMGHLSHFCVPKTNLTLVPKGVSSEAAAFTNLMQVSLRSVRQAEINLGGSVLIFGLGLIGQFAQLFSRINGATRVVCIDPSARRRELAKKTGLMHAFDPIDKDLDKKIKEVTGNGQFDAVFDSTGVPNVVSKLPAYVRDFGTLMILGGVHKPVELDLYTHIQKRSLRLIGSGSPDPHNFPYDNDAKNQQTILDLMQNKTLNIDPLITHFVPVEEAPKMYRMLQEEKDAGLGVAFQW